MRHILSLTAYSRKKKRWFGPRFRQRAADLLQPRTQGPNETVTSFVEDILCLSSRADPQATDEKKLRFLMRGVKSEIFGGLIRNPPTTVEEFVAEATNIEWALMAQASHYHRLSNVSTLASTRSEFCTGADELRDIIRDVVRQELRKLFPAPERPASLSVAEIVRDEVQRALQPEPPVDVPAPEEPTLTYAAIARRQPEAPRQAATPPRRDPPAP